MTEENGNIGSVKNTEMTDSEKGTAALKAQYLTTKEKFHEFLDSGRQSSDDVGQAEDGVEPVPKKIKLEDVAQAKETALTKKKERGQFKSRPHIKPQTYTKNKLCPSMLKEHGAECFYGERCKFFHNISEYMELKPADIGERCFLFDHFGKCRYGVTCRYAKAHTSEDFKNLVNDDLWSANKEKLTVKNSLDKDLQRQLRKRQVCFKASEEYLRTIAKGGQQDSATKAATENKLQQPCCTQESPLGKAEKASVGIAGDETSPKIEPQLHSEEATPVKTCGPLTDIDIVKLRPCERKQVNFKDKLYLAPLTTCGNLPFRRICKRFGADITCGEMAMCTNLLQGQSSEWALLKRHESEDLFGVQLEGCFPDTMTRCAELLNKNIDVDFVDINSGCPIDLVYKKGGGCGLMSRAKKFEQIVRGMNTVLDVPLTVKIRTGVQDKVNIAHKLIPEMKNWGVSLITLHGRSREQRYTKLADWDYIDTCSKLASPVPLFGNGDILSYEDAVKARETGVSGIMLARGALIKPWLFTEIKEKRHWDISSGERLDILRDFTHFGLEHWGSDTQGIEKTRLFMLEWLSFMCRYIPVGLLERVPQKINERPPYYMGRDYLESLMASQHAGDWIKISEMLLGPVPHNFTFLPKHKANAYK
ncbi:hypothetical protein GJAV_G00101060 [Gymnothorax javanicus]|nr:hypothetical protein GJAV_G00101060 [Gymnothorax javanicus]